MRRLKATGRHSTTAIAIAALLIGPPGAAYAQGMQGDDAGTFAGTAKRAAQSQRQEAQGQGAQKYGKSLQGRAADSGARSRNLADRVFAELVDRSPDYAAVDVSAERGTVTLAGTVPSERAAERAVRIARQMQGVAGVQNEMRVENDAATAAQGEPPPDSELSRRVAQAVANGIPGAKAGEDWWFTGWRVEGPQNAWNLIVQADRGNVTLEGDVPRAGIVTAAVRAARDVSGVRTVDSQLELPIYGSGWPYPTYGYGPGHFAPDSYVIFVPEDTGKATAKAPATGDAQIGMGAGPGEAAAGTAMLRGEIARIDPDNETMTVETQSGSVMLPLPQAEGMDLAAGDQVQVEVAIREQSRRTE